MASIYDNQLLSEKDRERIEKLGRLWSQTKDSAARKEYHEAAESIRQGYGYSGGDDGYQYNPIEEAVVSSALATKDYANALRQAESLRSDGYDKMAEQLEIEGNERLRAAYIKNMQQALGITQSLKAQGLSGGISESTRAGMENAYLGIRDDIMKDVDKSKSEIEMQKANSLADSESEIAKMEFDAANDRADKMTASEQKRYDRAQDAYNKEYQQKKDAYEREWQQKLFDYQKALDTYDREYQKKLDTYDREYQAKNDELNRKHEMNKVYASKSLSSQNKNNSAANEEKEKLQKQAWELLKHGVYDESFPELLGYSEDMLMTYMQNVMAGF